MKQKTIMCVACNESKPADDFYSNGYGGKKAACKTCVKKACAAYRKDNKAQRAEYARNKRDKDILKARQYERSKYANNPLAYKSKSARWSKNNRDWLNKKQQERLRNDPLYAIVRRLRGRLWHALRGSIKAASTFDLVGCSPSELMRHIEAHFVDGMSWSNRSEWHIDHIRPCDSYDMSKEDQQRKCFHYTNLRPLWRTDNLRKGKKYDRE